MDETFELERDSKGAPCKCGGYMDSVDTTKKEDKEFGCGRTYPCCSRAFVCRVCKKRYACQEPAPDMG